MYSKNDLSKQLQKMVDAIHTMNNERRARNGQPCFYLNVNYDEDSLNVWQRDATWFAHLDELVLKAHKLNLQCYMNIKTWKGKKKLTLRIIQ